MPAFAQQVPDAGAPISELAATDGYTELSARVAWRASERLEFAVKGFNLLNETHREYADPQGHVLRRSVLAELRYSY